jgi:hypothetical protein
VNRPSVEALRPDHRTGKFVPHATSQEKRQGKKCGRGEGSARDRNRGRRTRRTPENTVSHEQRRRRVTFVLDFQRAGSRRLSLKASWSSSGVASGKSDWNH